MIWTRIRSWLVTALRRSRTESEMDAELRLHIESYANDLVLSSVPREEALRRACLEFGGLDRAKEESRDALGINLLESLRQDARYGLRMLGKSWGLTIILAITLALGIGVNTAIFSVLNGWLFRPLPVRAPEQIMVVALRQKGGSNFSYPDFLDFQKQSDAFAGLFAYGTGGAGLSANGQASEFAYSAVTGNYFSVLGVNPALGRLFLQGEGEKPGEALTVVLGYSYWQKRFGGDAGIIGKQVLVNGKPATIIGIAPEGFHGTFFAFDMDGYLPLSSMSLFQAGDPNQFWTDRHDRRLTALGRLKPGVSLRQAQSSADVIAERLAAQYPDSDKEVTIRIIPEKLARPAPLVTSFVPVIASLFLALPALVLLLACMNVTNILLARATARRREIAIRAALGAGRARLIRQLLTESLLLGFLGAIAGLVLGKWAISASGSMLRSVITTSSNFGFSLDCGLDWRVFVYALGIAILTGVLVGIWPAFFAGRADLNSVLHEGGRGDSAGTGRSRGRSILVMAQVAGSATLLIVAGLFIRSLNHAEHMYLGFDPDHVLAVMMDTQQIGYDEAQTKSFCRRLKDRVRTMPGAQSASFSLTVPFGMPSPASPIYIEGHPLAPDLNPPEVSFNSIDPAYFDTLRIPLLEGRTFRDSDNDTARPVAIVNQTMAQRFWPGEDPLGKRFSLKSPAGPFIEVVGLARDGQTMWRFTVSPEPYFYLPLEQNFRSFLVMQIRSSIPPESLTVGAQGEIHKLAPDLPIMDVRTMLRTVHGLSGFFIFRLAASLAVVMGLLGLALAVVGIYGVVSFSVSQRTREIGIRTALGAAQGDILNLVLRRGLALVIAGIGFGLVVAWILTRAMSSLLMGVSPADPLTYAAVAVLLSAVALAACWIPARRATRVDPMIALRYE